MVGDHGKTLHVRLPADLHQKFERLRAEYKGLASSHVLRMLIADQLNKSLEDQSQIIQTQIRGEQLPGPQNRLPSLNRRNRQ